MGCERAKSDPKKHVTSILDDIKDKMECPYSLRVFIRRDGSMTQIRCRPRSWLPDSSIQDADSIESIRLALNISVYWHAKGDDGEYGVIRP